MSVLLYSREMPGMGVLYMKYINYLTERHVVAKTYGGPQGSLRIISQHISNH